MKVTNYQPFGKKIDQSNGPFWLELISPVQNSRNIDTCHSRNHLLLVLVTLKSAIYIIEFNRLVDLSIRLIINYSTQN